MKLAREVVGVANSRVGRGLGNGNVRINLTLADIDPQRLLQGDVPRLLDERQIAPKLWDAVRFEVDHRDEMGQFILTVTGDYAYRRKYGVYVVPIGCLKD